MLTNDPYAGIIDYEYLLLMQEEDILREREDQQALRDEHQQYIQETGEDNYS